MKQNCGFWAHKWSMAALLAASLFLLFPAIGQAAPRHILAGHVLDDAVSGAQITVSDASSGKVVGKGQTDADGYYQIKVDPADAYRVESAGGNLNGHPYQAELNTICSASLALAPAQFHSNAKLQPFPSANASSKSQGANNGQPFQPPQGDTDCTLTPLTTLAVLAIKANTQLDPLQAYAQAQTNLHKILSLPAQDAFMMDALGETQDAVKVTLLRTRIGDGSDLDALLKEILADIADGSLDGEARVYFPHALSRADVLIQHVQGLMQGDPSIVQTSDAQLDQILAPSRTPAAQLRERQLEHNHDLVLHATDPEPSWISTRASTQMVIGQPGASYNVDLVMLDGGGNVLGPVDSSKLRIELRIERNATTFDYIPAEFQGDYVGWDASTPGRLNIHVPADLTHGRLIIGVRPKFSDPGQAAIAERWSVPILVDVWPTKPEATVVDEASVYYPLGADAHFRTGSAFDTTAITTALQQAAADPTLSGEPLKALVVDGMGLQVGQLIDYRLPDPTGGIYPYGGRVVKVIAGTGAQQLALVNFEILSTYDVLMGNDDQFIKQGVMPEFVTYRSGDALPATGTQPTAPSYFGPADQATIQASGSGLFDVSCDMGSAAMAITPSLKFDVDTGVSAGINYSVGFKGAAVSCKIDAEAVAIDIPFGGPVGALLQKLVGTGVSVGPYGEIKLDLEAGSGFTDFSIGGGASYPQGVTPPEAKWDGSFGSGLDATPITAKVTLGGEVGVEAKLSALKISSWFGDYDVSLTGKAGYYAAYTGEALNAAAAKDGSNSSFGTEFGFKVGTEASGGLINLLKYLGAKPKLSVDYTVGATKKVDAGYNLGDVYDDGQGKAFAVLQPGSALLRQFMANGSTANGYASLANSSVYNDPNSDITYHTSECQADGGTITTPLIGCMGGFFCGAVNAPAKLCGGQIYVNAIHGSGNEGDTVTATSSAGITQSADPNAPPVSVTVSGNPLSPTPASFQLTPGGQPQDLTATATCPSRGVHLGTITASSSGTSDSKEDLLTCACKPGTSDCDRTWGDPYMLTADGMAYDFIASGDYILQEVVDDNNNPIPGLQVQARFLPGYDVSWPQGAALQVGDDVVEISPAIIGHDTYAIGMEVRVNGQYVFPPAVNGTGGTWESLLQGRTIRLPGGGLIFVDSFIQKYYTYKPNSLTVVWPTNGPFSGYALQLKEPAGISPEPQPFLSLQFIRPTEHTGHERGMMGNNDGDPSNDFQRRNGEVLGQDTPMSWTALYGLFGGDWLVRPQECLFADGCTGQPDFPTSADVLTPDQRAVGEAACANLTGFYQDACIHDVGLTGDVSLVQSYYANTTDLNWMASQLQTPGVDLPVYRLSGGGHKALPGGTFTNPVYRLGATVTQVTGDGKFLLTLRPPRGATATFTEGQPGSLASSLTATGDLTTSVDVDCGQPDPNWATLGDAWQQNGALQLWVLDPLSGFAKQMEGEIPLSCSSTGKLLAAGYMHSLALTDSGGLFAWGYNGYGELGDGTTLLRHIPVAVSLAVLSGAHMVSVAARNNHTVALDDSGRVWAWGDNGYGELGDGTTTNRSTPVAVDLTALNGAKVVSVEAGAQHTVALDDSGRVWAWGYNGYGQLGDGITTNHSSPVAVDLPALNGAKVIAMAAGNNHTVALDDAGRVWAWGYNGHGQLGDGTTTNRTTPVAVDLTALAGAKVVAVAAGDDYTVALDDQGRVWSWGYNGSGQLGDGTATNRTGPVLVNFTSLNGAKVVALTAGSNHTLALDDTGQLWAWGYNGSGQLGDGSMINRLTPVVVNLTALGGAKVVAMAAGGYHTLARDDKGQLWGWGSNGYGQVGDGTTARRTLPVLIGVFTGGIQVSGTLPATATIPAGHDVELGGVSVADIRLGLATLSVQGAGLSVDVPGQGSTVVAKGQSDHPLYGRCDTPGTVQSVDYSVVDDTGAVLYSGNMNLTCVADIRQSVSLDSAGGVNLAFTNGGAWGASLRFTPAPGVTLPGMTSWEGNLAQQSGQALSLTGISCPFSGLRDLGVLSFLDAQGQVYGQQKVIAWGQSVCGARVTAGWAHTLAVYGAGRLATWGANAYGQLGDGTLVQKTSPVAVDLSALNGAKVVSAVAGDYHTTALDNSGRVWAWGNNGYGQLGDGTTTNRATPTVVDLTALNGAKVVSLAAGTFHSVVLDDSGRVWSWGYNGLSQLGDGTTTNHSTPEAVDLTALKGVKVASLAVGSYHTLALDEAGQLWSWGYNGYGQLGDGTTLSRSTPVAIYLGMLGGAKVVGMVAGQSHSLALDDAGRLWAWGYNGSGQLGDGTTVSRTTPVMMDLSALNGAKVVSMAAGAQFTLALDDSGQLWATGANESGEQGNGTTQNHTTLTAVDQSALGGAKVVDVAAGANYAFAVDESGRLWGWGYNRYGQVGDGSTWTRTRPVLIGAVTGGIRVSSTVPATVTIPVGRDVELGRLSVTNIRFGSTELTLQGAGLGLDAPGQTTAVLPKGQSDHLLYWRCDTPGTAQAVAYSLVDDSGAVVYSGSVNITCVEEIRQSVTLDSSGALNLSLTNAGTSTASLLFTPATGVSLSGMTSWTGSLAQQSGQNLSLTGISCPFSGERDLGVLSFLDAQGQVYAEQQVTAWGQSVCGSGAQLSAGTGHTLVVYGAGQLAAWGDNRSAQLGDGTLTQQNFPVAVDLTALNGAKVVSAAAGAAHSVALDETGALWAWGNNDYGQLGSATTITTTTTLLVGPMPAAPSNSMVAVDLTPLGGVRVISVAAGGNHTVALDQAGGLWAWGYNGYGQLGDGTTTNRTTPVAVSLGALDGAKVVLTAAGEAYTLAVDDAGRVWSWGYNGNHQLGDGTTTNRTSPVAVDLSALGGARVVAVAAGRTHSLALDETGRLWGWGDNSSGQLGDGTTVSRATPVMTDLSALNGARIVSLAAGEQFSLVLDDSGQLWATGANGSGQQGDGTNQIHTTLAAVDQSALGGAKVVDMAVGAGHAIALDESGRLWAWGYNHYGQVGDGTTVSRLTPVLIGPISGGVVQVSASNLPADATLTDGKDTALGTLTVSNGQLTRATLQLQGNGFSLDAVGQTTSPAPHGDSTHTLYGSCSAPGTQQLMSYSLYVAGNLLYSGQVNVTCMANIHASAIPANGGLTLSLTNAGTASASLRFTPASGVVLSGATSWEGTLVQQGQQTLTITGVQCPFNGVQTLGLVEFLDSQGQVYGQKTVTAAPAICQKPVHVAGGQQHTLALDAAGRLWGWGYNGEGEVGNWSSSYSVVTPSAVNLANVVSVAASPIASYAIDTMGKLWGWGEYIRTPKAISLSPLDGARVVSIATGLSQTVALDETGRLWQWTDVAEADSEVKAVDLSSLGGAGVVSVAAGRDHVLAVDDQGRLWAWGTYYPNYYGQLGIGAGPFASPTAPVAVDLSFLGGAKIRSIAAGVYHSLLLDDAGRVWAWGNNGDGELGDGTQSNRFTPVAVDLSVLNGAHVVAIAAGMWHSVALDDVGRVWAWGSDKYGQLGPGEPYRSLTPTLVDLSSLNGTKVVSIAAGYAHTMVLDASGRLWGWGLDNYGQVGDGSSGYNFAQYYPSQVNSTALGGTLWGP